LGTVRLDHPTLLCGLLQSVRLETGTRRPFALAGARARSARERSDGPLRRRARKGQENDFLIAAANMRFGARHSRSSSWCSLSQETRSRRASNLASKASNSDWRMPPHFLGPAVRSNSSTRLIVSAWKFREVFLFGLASLMAFASTNQIRARRCSRIPKHTTQSRFSLSSPRGLSIVVRAVRLGVAARTAGRGKGSWRALAAMAPMASFRRSVEGDRRRAVQS
jgi:hypothetical protein